MHPISAATGLSHPRIALQEAIATVDSLLATAERLTRDAEVLQGKHNHPFVTPILIISLTEQLPRILDHFNEDAAADSKYLVTVFCFRVLFTMAFHRYLGPRRSLHT